MVKSTPPNVGPQRLAHCIISSSLTGLYFYCKSICKMQALLALSFIEVSKFSLYFYLCRSRLSTQFHQLLNLQGNILNKIFHLLDVFNQSKCFKFGRVISLDFCSIDAASLIALKTLLISKYGILHDL